MIRFWFSQIRSVVILAVAAVYGYFEMRHEARALRREADRK